MLNNLSFRILPTLWDGDGIHTAWTHSAQLLRALQPAAVQLHTTDPRAIVPTVRAAFPNAALVIGVGVDWIARDVAKGTRTVPWGVAQLVELAERVRDTGAVAIKWNAEGRWKTAPDTVQRARLRDVVRLGLGRAAERCPNLVQWFTGFDHPAWHMSFNWVDWLGQDSPVLAAYAQVYGAPGGGLSAHRGDLPRREVRALASWAAAVRQGAIRPDAPAGTPEDLKDLDWRPYYQLHSNDLGDTILSALAHDDGAAFWALRSRSDTAGVRALAALTAFDRLGRWGKDALVTYQREHPECGSADNRYGTKTEAVLLREARIDPALVV